MIPWHLLTTAFRNKYIVKAMGLHLLFGFMRISHVSMPLNHLLYYCGISGGRPCISLWQSISFVFTGKVWENDSSWLWSFTNIWHQYIKSCPRSLMEGMYWTLKFKLLISSSSQQRSWFWPQVDIQFLLGDAPVAIGLHFSCSTSEPLSHKKHLSVTIRAPGQNLPSVCR